MRVPDKMSSGEACHGRDEPDVGMVPEVATEPSSCPDDPMLEGHGGENPPLSVDGALPGFSPRPAGQAPAVMSMPEFRLGDVQAWKQHLEDHGVVRIRAVLSKEEVTEAHAKFWDWLESLGGQADRHDAATWTDDNFPGELGLGFMCTRGGGQSAAAWYLRGHRGVHRAFSEIWGTDELISSFDTFISWRPWWHGGCSVKPSTEGIHCDQNPHKRLGRAAVQGMITLRPVTRRTGGLCVVPDSHTDAVQEHLRQRFRARHGDWLPLEQKYPKDPLCRCGELIEAEPGDLILWDSRALHGGWVGPGPQVLEPVSETETGPSKEPTPLASPELARLVFTVCMVPKNWAHERVLQKRAGAVTRGLTLTHWPDAYEPHGFDDTGGQSLTNIREWKEGYRPPTLDDWQQSLVGAEVVIRAEGAAPEVGGPSEQTGGNASPCRLPPAGPL